MKKKGNMFAEAEEKRRAEMKKNEDGARVGHEERKATTVVLSRRNKIALKQYAAAMGSTASEIINSWIEEKCAKFIS